jgi:outer membrane porin, OprD family
MKRKLHYLFPLLLSLPMSWSTSLGAMPSQVRSDSLIHTEAPQPDSAAGLTNFIRRGYFFGHVRSYWMGTNNRGALQDYHALALGAGIGYRTVRIAGHVELGMSGFFMFNVFSSDLAAPDPLTGKGSRYEVGLFNIEEPNNREDLDRLEEFYIRYYVGRASRVTVGRQIPASPFVNPQDGRMRPTLTEGVVLEWNEWKRTRIRAEYLTRISPRSTVRWFDIGESIGLLPSGVTTDGQPSRYAGNVESSHLLMLGITQEIGKLKVNLWETAVPGLFHTAYSRIEWHQPLHSGGEWWLGGQASRQWTMGNGGNEEARLAYIDPNHRATVFSGQAGLQLKRWTWSLNATRITAEGRFLMPREWGREPFYTFMFRERNEGLGNVSALTAGVNYKAGEHWRWEFTAGTFRLPSVSNTRLNKYSLPSYSQLNLRTVYHFSGLPDGLDAELLFTQKLNQTGRIIEDKVAQNRVDMNLVNVIVNYRF